MEVLSDAMVFILKEKVNRIVRNDLSTYDSILRIIRDSEKSETDKKNELELLIGIRKTVLSEEREV